MFDRPLAIWLTGIVRLAVALVGVVPDGRITCVHTTPQRCPVATGKCCNHLLFKVAGKAASIWCICYMYSTAHGAAVSWGPGRVRTHTIYCVSRASGGVTDSRFHSPCLHRAVKSNAHQARGQWGNPMVKHTSYSILLDALVQTCEASSTKGCCMCIGSPEAHSCSLKLCCPQSFAHYPAVGQPACSVFTHYQLLLP